MKSRQPGLFDVEERAAQLTKMGDLLVGLKARRDWKDRKSQAGAKPFDVGLIYTILVLQRVNRHRSCLLLQDR